MSGHPVIVEIALIIGYYVLKTISWFSKSLVGVATTKIEAQSVSRMTSESHD